MKPDLPRPIGRPARISREDIALAALEIGLDTVTMTAVARHLGVDHSSLYRHVKGREDMLVLAVDHAVDTIVWAKDSSEWRAYLTDAAQASWDIYMRYTGLAEVVRDLRVTPMKVIMAFTRICRHLEACGFAFDDAVLIVDSVMDMTCDSAAAWWIASRSTDNGSTGVETLRASWHAAAAAEKRLNRHAAAVTQIIDGDPEDWWRRKLEILLDGAAARKQG